jgi:Domain of unknown function (DUF4202)
VPLIEAFNVLSKRPSTAQHAHYEKAHTNYRIMPGDFSQAISLIDTAHSQDPNQTTFTSSLEPLPYELHYANKMASYLTLHTPEAPPLLRLAVRAQHLRRWEIPRSSYPDGKAGYFAWRAYLKKRQAEQARGICLECGYSDEEAERVASLVKKEDLKKGEGNGDPEVQILEDVACLVFLDDQFEKFEKEHDEEKIVGILRKTWVKMGQRGQELALGIQMSERGKELVQRALSG